MSNFYDDIAGALLVLLAVCGLVAFIRLIIIGDITLGTCGLVLFILFGLAVYRRGKWVN